MAEGDELLRRCMQGDSEALAGLVQLHEERLFRLAYRVLGDAGRAEEAVLDAWVKVWDRCGQWRGEAAAGTWIYRLALRTFLDHARKRGRGEPLAETVDGKPTPLEKLVEAERQHEIGLRLELALRKLTAEDRALLHLYYFEGRALAEIEPILGVGFDALKMRLSRARLRLREGMEGCDELLRSE